MKKIQDINDIIRLWEKKGKVIPFFHAKWQKQVDELIEIGNDPNTVWYEDEPDNDIIILKTYVGSLFHFIPSGKYYTPWANSNVSLREAAIDELWNEFIEDAFSDEEFNFESSENCPTDILLVKYKPYVKPIPEPLDDKNFDKILLEIVTEDMTIEDLLRIPEIYEILSEIYHNEVIEKWEEEQNGDN